jgi:deferrochelatase/peroxidase EfeB
MQHSFLTVAIPFDPARVANVEACLDQIGNPVVEPVRALLRNKGIHFFSICVVPGDSGHGAFLLFEATADQPDIIKVLVDNLGSAHLATIAQTAGLTTSTNPTSALQIFEQLMRRHTLTVGQGLFATPGLCFAGTPGMPLDRIREEYELGRAVRGHLESGRFQGTPLQVLQQVRAEIQTTPQAHLLAQHASPLLQPAPADGLSASDILGGFVLFTWPYLLAALLATVTAGAVVWTQRDWFWGVVAAVFVSAAVAIFLVLLLAWAYATLRRLEESDVPDNSAPEPKRLAEVIHRENRHAFEQNHLYGFSIMKPGRLRNLILRLVFYVIVTNASRISRPGFLGELGTIHFARWVLLPGTNKLLFFSNYGGSWESYLEDFITKAHAGLTGVWSNCVGFPRARNVFQDGASDGERFKRWARRLQQPTRVWYSAYPHLTTARIRLNSAIRQGLASAATEDEAEQWLSCFGSRPRSGPIIESHDVQAILFGGMGYLNHATCFLIRLPDVPGSARHWLSEVAGSISFGDTPPPNTARTVAFSQRGLRKLGCDDNVISEFSIAFQEGMSEPHRAAILSDTGDDKPANWRWGHGDQYVDAALMLYADSAERLVQEANDIRSLLQEHAATLVYELPLTAYDPTQPTREPFGFVDGVSQPIVRGTRRWISESDANHVVEPGEFILGYLDNRGYLPLTPTVPATSDPHNILPAFRETPPGDLPDFNRLAGNGPRDLGRNGSYLVIRQLEQNVELFNQFLKETALRVKGHPGVPAVWDDDHLVEWIGAKVIGRWRDGSSLVRFPHAPANWNYCKPGPYPNESGTAVSSPPAHTPDNAFLLGAEDPLGERCPYGSHIRRTNPRDSLSPHSKDQIAITNRHRILRVGRAYSPQQVKQETPPRPGLLFMCLNSDIGRQFEFIQQTWASARLFHGLDGEVDPLLGRGGKGGRLTIPSAEGPLLLSGIQDFVTVRGGGYFFLPGRRALRYLAGNSTTDRHWAVEAVTPSASGREGREASPNARPAWDEVH